MTGAALLQLVVLIAMLAISSPLLGRYLAAVYSGRPTAGDRLLGPLDRLIFRVTRVDPSSEQRWTGYARSLLAFSAVSVLVLYVQLRLQGQLFGNPDGMAAVPPALAFNTAVSFLTNTNWQNYGGESTMSHLTQMTGLAFHNFVSAAAGAGVALALIRGLTRSRSATVGNFWVDLVRTCTRVLLPLALAGSVVLMSQGVIQNFDGAKRVTTVAGTEQVIPGGPVASQEAIKEGGQNGGGFFNANAAHPFENPNGVTNLLQLWMILAIPFAFPFAFGAMAGNHRQGLAVFATMFGIWLAMTVAVMAVEARGNPYLDAAGVDQTVSATVIGGSLEGKEARFGTQSCAMYVAATTNTSTGSVNCAHDSLTPLGGAVPLVSMMLGEISPGGTGSGMYGILVFALLAVFIAGLMVGRTPELLGKKVQAAEMKLAVLYILFVPVAILCFASASLVMDTPHASLLNDGPHGLSEMVYAFTSAANNNGSAFGGLSGNTNWFNATLGISMLVGRFLLMIPVLAIAGSLAGKQKAPVTSGTFPTDTPLFAALLTGVIVIVVGLTFFPVVSLGPIVEHLSGSF